MLQKPINLDYISFRTTKKSLKHKINENKNNLTTNSQRKLIKHKKRNNIMKDLFLNPIKSPYNTNNNGKNSHKTYLKPSDYINEIAKKIFDLKQGDVSRG